MLFRFIWVAVDVWHWCAGQGIALWHHFVGDELIGVRIDIPVQGSGGISHIGQAGLYGIVIIAA